MLSTLRHLPASLLFVSALSTAPMQCARETEPDKAMEEEPGEALYALAEQFRERGDRDARAATLRYLVDHYPSSRFAERARQDLSELGAPPSEAKSP